MVIIGHLGTVKSNELQVIGDSGNGRYKVQSINFQDDTGRSKKKPLDFTFETSRAVKVRKMQIVQKASGIGVKANSKIRYQSRRDAERGRLPDWEKTLNWELGRTTDRASGRLFLSFECWILHFAFCIRDSRFQIDSRFEIGDSGFRW